MIRPSLKIAGGNPVPVSMLQNPQLVVTAINQDGISTTKVIDNLELSEKKETLCEFVVPPRLKSVSLSLAAKIDRLFPRPYAHFCCLHPEEFFFLMERFVLSTS